MFCPAALTSESASIPERSQSTEIVALETRIVWARKVDRKRDREWEIDEEPDRRDLGYGR